MTPWSLTSTLWLEPFTHVKEALATGMTVTVEAARTTPSTLTPTCTAQRIGEEVQNTEKSSIS